MVPLKSQVEINSESEFQSHCLFMIVRIDPGKTIWEKFFPSIIDDECHLQLDPVFRDFSLIVQFDLLIFYPGRLEVLERFMSACNAQQDRIIKTLRG